MRELKEIQSACIGATLRKLLFFLACFFVLIPIVRTATQAADDPAQPTAIGSQDQNLAAQLGVRFLAGSSTKLILERDGRQYELDLPTQQVRELPLPAPQETSTLPAQSNTPAGTPTAGPVASKAAQADNSNNARRRYYRPGDDLVFTIPTGRPIDKHSLTINFTHRFPYEPAFTTPARGATVLGLDDFAIPSFGLQYGITSRFSVSAYRSPTIIGRPIELGAKYRFAEERRDLLNITGRFSVDGQDNFARNFTTNFELIVSRSLTSRAQIYLDPAVSLHNRPTLAAQNSLINAPSYQPCSRSFADDVPASLQVHSCANTFSVGVGAAIDIRPTVALVGEVIPTAINGTELGIHRLPFSFGIQKKIYHHAFTFGLTTAPGTTTSERIATRAIYLRQPNADTPSNMFVGFDIMRQIP